MTRNYWEEFAKIFGLNLYEIFHFEGDERAYRFSYGGLQYALSDDAEEIDWIDYDDCPETYVDMLDGTITIEEE